MSVEFTDVDLLKMMVPVYSPVDREKNSSQNLFIYLINEMEKYKRLFLDKLTFDKLSV